MSDKDTGIVQVRYYWYGEQDDTLVEQEDANCDRIDRGDRRASLERRRSIPPMAADLLCPQDGIGPMRLLAVGDISRGRLGIRSVFDEIVVRVEPSAELRSIEFETDKPLRLGRLGQSSDYGHVDSMGKIFDLPVIGDVFRRRGSIHSLAGKPVPLTFFKRTGHQNPSAWHCCKLSATARQH